MYAGAIFGCDEFYDTRRWSAVDPFENLNLAVSQTVCREPVWMGYQLPRHQSPLFFVRCACTGCFETGVFRHCSLRLISAVFTVALFLSTKQGFISCQRVCLCILFWFVTRCLPSPWNLSNFVLYLKMVMLLNVLEALHLKCSPPHTHTHFPYLYLHL